MNAENSGFKELYNLYTNDFIYSKLISKLKEKKITMLIVSHEMNFVREISDRVIVMEKGEILETGTSSQIFENPLSQRVKEFLNTTINS